MDFDTLSQNVGDLGKLIVAKGFKTCPKSNKSSDLVTLIRRQVQNDIFTVGPVI